MHGDTSRPIRASSQEGLVPKFGLIACIGENEGRVCRIDFLDDIREHRKPDVTCPRKPIDRLGEEDFELHRSALIASDDRNGA